MPPFDNKEKKVKLIQILHCAWEKALKVANQFLIIKPGFFIDTVFSAQNELLRQLQTKVFSYHLRSDGKLVYKYLADFQSSQLKKRTRFIVHHAEQSTKIALKLDHVFLIRTFRYNIVM